MNRMESINLYTNLENGHIQKYSGSSRCKLLIVQNPSIKINIVIPYHIHIKINKKPINSEENIGVSKPAGNIKVIFFAM